MLFPDGVYIGGVRSPTGNNLADALRWYIDFLSQSILAKPHGYEELFQQELSGGHGIGLSHNVLTSVVIDKCGPNSRKRFVSHSSPLAAHLHIYAEHSKQAFDKGRLP
jgi:hypothetical protein